MPLSVEFFYKRIQNALLVRSDKKRYSLLLEIIKDYIQDYTDEGFFINSDNESLTEDIEKGGLVYNHDTDLLYIKNSSGVIQRSAFTALAGGLVPSLTGMTVAIGGFAVGDNVVAITGTNLDTASAASIATDNAKVVFSNPTYTSNVLTGGTLTIADNTVLDTAINMTVTIDGVPAAAPLAVTLSAIKTVSAVVSGGAFGPIPIGTTNLVPSSYTAPVTGTAPVDETWKYTLKNLDVTASYDYTRAKVSFTDLKGVVEFFSNVATGTNSTIASSVTGLSNDGIVNDGVFQAYTIGAATVTLSKGDGWT
jgi:hypothetical protein